MTRYLPLLFVLSACEDTVDTTDVSFAFDGLEALGEDFVYENWLIIDDAPVSTGRFTVDADGVPSLSSYTITDAQAAGATAYVLTIEPAEGDDPAPSDTKLLGGDLSDGMATGTIAHGAALGDDFSEAAGGYILETPTSAATDDASLGVWFLDPTGDDGPVAALTLPELPAGWVYEGWAVVDGTPTSTGRFTEVDAADDDGAGDAAGPEDAPPFPGQDFIDPALDLDGATIVISIEPEPDDSAAPFTLKPLVGSGASTDGLQTLTNQAEDTSPTATVTFE